MPAAHPSPSWIERFEKLSPMAIDKIDFEQDLAIDRARQTRLHGDGVLPWTIETRPYYQIGEYPGLTAAQLDVHRVGVFQHLPLVNTMLRAVQSFDPAPRIVQQNLYLLFHQTMWARWGRRVYVLDDDFATLLLHTPLPSFDATEIMARVPAFYVKLPRGLFTMQHIREKQIQPVDGLSVVTAPNDPVSPLPREVSVIVAAMDETNFSNSNIEWATMSLDPRVTLNDDVFKQALESKPNDMIARPMRDPIWERVVPRLVIGLMLYMACEHPDLVPVRAPRPDLSRIRSPKEREAAQRNFDHKHRHASHLGYIRVGAREGDIARQQWRAIGGASTSRKLDHRVWVSGHWRQQPHGEGRLLRKRIWIKPFPRGPDYADSLVVRAARVQPGEPAS